MPLARNDVASLNNRALRWPSRIGSASSWLSERVPLPLSVLLSSATHAGSSSANSQLSGLLLNSHSYVLLDGWIDGGATTYPPSPLTSMPAPSSPAELRTTPPGWRKKSWRPPPPVCCSTADGSAPFLCCNTASDSSPPLYESISKAIRPLFAPVAIATLAYGHILHHRAICGKSVVASRHPCWVCGVFL